MRHAADLAHRQRPAELRAALRAEPGVAAVQRAAAGAGGDAGLAQLDDVAALVEHALDRAQLAVDGVQGGELAQHELVVAAPEAVQVEGQAAEVAEAELADAAQVAQPPPEPAAVAEAGTGGGDVLGSEARGERIGRRCLRGRDHGRLRLLRARVGRSPTEPDAAEGTLHRKKTPLRRRSGRYQRVPPTAL